MSTILRTVWLGFLDGSIAGDGKRIKDNLTKNSNDTDKKPLTSVNISTFPKNRISEALSLFLGSHSAYSRIITATTVSINGCNRSLKYVVILSWR
jgi:hypothetical protein